MQLLLGHTMLESTVRNAHVAVSDAMRRYKLTNIREIAVQSLLRLFIVPTLMLFSGSLGSAFIRFRWR